MFKRGWTRSSPHQGNVKRARRVRLCLERLEERTVPSLVAAFSFDQGSGSVLSDLSGNGNNGTITNAVWRSGKYGTALQFNGSANSYVTIPSAASLQLTKGMTLEAWVDPSTLNSLDDGWVAALAKEHRNSSNDIAYALYAANGTGTAPAGHILVNNNDRGVQG